MFRNQYKKLYFSVPKYRVKTSGKTRVETTCEPDPKWVAGSLFMHGLG